MAEEHLDAESSTRSKRTTPMEHFVHLVKIGYRHDSYLLKQFIKEHGLPVKFDRANNKWVRTDGRSRQQEQSNDIDRT